jgi:hypothetical protein
MDSEDFKPLRYTNRWFCYLDLLGFTALVNDKNIEQVIPLYQKALTEMERIALPKKRHGVTYSWFSDTFIIYSRGGKDQDFAYVEHVGRLFFQSLILHQIPVRGALTYGNLYSQSSKNIFVGPALIDAYYYGERQDWLGFVLTPNVFSRLTETTVDLRYRMHYRLVTEPGIIKHQPSTPVYAFAFNNGMVNGRNPYLSALKAMKEKAGQGNAHKYENTISFIHKHARAVSLSNNSAQLLAQGRRP